MQFLAKTWLLSLLLLDSAVACAAAPPATMTSAPLRQLIADTQATISSFRVVYRCPAVDSAAPAGAYLYRVVAVKYPSSLYHLSAHGHDAVDWQDDPFRQVAYLGSDELYVHFPINRGHFYRSYAPDAALPGTLKQELYFHATGLWPFESRVPPRNDDLPVILRDVAQSDRYVVRPRLERVGERWCHVLEVRGRDALWLDASRGGCLLQREVYAPATAALMKRFVLGGHREVSPGIWMPFWLSNMQFDFTAPEPAARRRLVIDSRLEMLEVSVNDVDDDQFSYEPQPGELEAVEQDKTPRQVASGGFDLLDENVRWIGRIQSGFAQQEEMVLWPIVAAGVLAMEVVLIEIYRRRRRNRDEAGG